MKKTILTLILTGLLISLFPSPVFAESYCITVPTEYSTFASYADTLEIANVDAQTVWPAVVAMDMQNNTVDSYTPQALQQGETMLYPLANMPKLPTDYYGCVALPRGFTVKIAQGGSPKSVRIFIPLAATAP